MSAPLFEVCLDSVSSAMAAQEGGAQRVELCADLREGGTTPSLGTIELCCESVTLDVMVMIRPRGQDFLYDAVELATMERDIDRVQQLAREAPHLRGVVFGLLRSDGHLDLERMGSLVERARPLEVTCHRAFDMTPDPHRALDELIELGVDRVLTSGQAPEVPAGIELLEKLVAQAGDALVVMPGAGITPANAREVLERTAAREFHATAWRQVSSGMEFRQEKVFMGEPDLSEFDRLETDPAVVRSFVDAARSAAGTA